ncbi:TPA: DUF4422 domain-containing protein [Klebsiella quasipneumoniae subsp. similipneumoniae]|nr:DUF4422 domain-containing protein [Klebsiella quasipneumoniae subsp. similipneumoniae]
MSPNENPSVKIIIATHKLYEFPIDEIYLPLQVGKIDKKSLGLTGDDEGDNISRKNAMYCELTGLYWAWKNLKYDYIGLVHYRRHFSVKSHFFWETGKFTNVLNYKELSSIILNADIIVPTKRNYYIETLYSHYAHTHHKEHLDSARTIIGKKYPSYLNSFDKIMNYRAGYMFNMMIMRRELLDKYCSWLFSILFELENEVIHEELNSFHLRYPGRVSEILFNVWIDHEKMINPTIKIQSLNHIHMEKINWIHKGKSFLMAKVRKNKYNGSF